jgi:oligogalacturonide lyase
MLTTLRRRALPVSLILFQWTLFTATPGAQTLDKAPPREWIDPDTGHRVVRLSDEPGSQSLYFHQNAYTPDGAKLIVTTPASRPSI